MLQTSTKKYFIQTYGCQANIADTNLIAGLLESLGLEKADSLESADIFIINSCSVRQKSEDKVYGLGQIFKQYELENKKKPFIVLAGCMVGSTTGGRKRFDFLELEKRTPWVDLYISPDQIGQLPELLEKNGVLSEWLVKKLNMDDVEPKYEGFSHAYVNISTGCDNFCTYCVVPYTRGEEVSRSKEKILREIDKLIEKGVKKVILCGQNVNSWGLPREEKFKLRTAGEGKLPFVQLLKDIHTIDEIKEIEFISSNPFDFTDDLIQTLKLPKISNYLHIAVQSGNNDVLEKMNRRHTVEEYIELINRIKCVRPDIELGTDVIVGFPGETRDQFMDTVRLFQYVKFSVAFISMYSPRKGTSAEKLLKDDVSLKEKKFRHNYLTQVWKESKNE